MRGKALLEITQDWRSIQIAIILRGWAVFAFQLRAWWQPMSKYEQRPVFKSLQYSIRSVIVPTHLQAAREMCIKVWIRKKWTRPIRSLVAWKSSLATPYTTCDWSSHWAARWTRPVNLLYAILFYKSLMCSLLIQGYKVLLKVQRNCSKFLVG